ncbi:MAG: hypothetical protein WDO74_22430 [Pseudomonadota bacterium]
MLERAFAGVCLFLSASLIACSAKEPAPAPGGSVGTVGGSSGAEAGGSAGVTSSGGVASVSGGAGGTASGGAAGSGGKATTKPTANCGEETCVPGQICISWSREFSSAGALDECAAAPDGCSASSLCDCNIPNWQGSPITGCVAIGAIPNLYVTDYRCGTARCGSDEICLIHKGDSAPASCVMPPDGCVVDADFCKADCGKQAATAAGLTLASCKSGLSGVGVTVR